MKSFFSRLLTLSLAAAVALGAWLPQTASAQTGPAMVINLTSAEPWRASMAAFVGTNFALKQGVKDVVMFANVEGVKVFDKQYGADTIATGKFDQPVQAMMAEFMAAGGKVLVCLVCIQAIDIPESRLIDGADVLRRPSTLNDVLFRPGTATLSW
ncbi:MAG: DsrE family protein [Burkholderiaceae bacterium]